jgi:hypothetical protein
VDAVNAWLPAAFLALNPTRKPARFALAVSGVWDVKKKQLAKLPSLPSLAIPNGLSFEQEATLVGLIGATASDLRKFLSHFKVHRLVDLTTVQYDAAIKMLRSKANSK